MHAAANLICDFLAARRVPNLAHIVTLQRRGILLYLCAILVLSAVGRASYSDEDKESSWKALSDEPSRAQLFKQYADTTSAQGGRMPFALQREFRLPEDASRDVDGSERKNSIFGVDISHYQGGHFPFPLLKRQHVSFVYVKATQGTDAADKAFGDNWKALASLPVSEHIPRGAYHFLSSSPAQAGKDQADRFLAYVALHGGLRSDDLAPALDLEWDRLCTTCEDRWATNGRSADDIINTVAEFVNRIEEATGRIPIIYTNKSFLADHGIVSDHQIQRLIGNSNVWIFDVSPSDLRLEIPDSRKNLGYVLWQFSSNAVLDRGYSGTLDVDIFKGSDAELRAKLLSQR